MQLLVVISASKTSLNFLSATKPKNYQERKMSSKKKIGIGSTLASILVPVVSGLLSRKSRDSETPKGAGRVRDFGSVLAGAGAANAIAVQAGANPIEWTGIVLTPDQNIILNAVLVVTGAVLHLWGIGKKTKTNER